MGEHQREPPRATAWGAARPPCPVLLLGAGPLGCRALEALSDVAGVLHVRVFGPFGFVAIGAAGRDGAGPRTWVQDEIPARGPAPPRGAVAPDRPDWPDRLRSLARQLCPVAATSPAGAWGAPATLHAYFLLDARSPDAVARGLEAARILRREPVGLDLTGLLLTGRTAQFQPEEARWRDGLKVVIAANDQEPLLHRLYILDGKNALQRWMQTEGDHARTAAEFVFHHGLSPYREALRRFETTRISPRQALEEVCGSFACRTLRADRAAIVDAVAEPLEGLLFPDAAEAGRDARAPADGPGPARPARAGGLLTPEQLAAIEAIAEGLVGRLDALFRGAFEAGRPVTAGDLAEPVRASVRAAVEQACRHAAPNPAPDEGTDPARGSPLEHLRGFLLALRGRIGPLKLRASVHDRRYMRRVAARGLRAAFLGTPGPAPPPPPLPAPAIPPEIAQALPPPPPLPPPPARPRPSRRAVAGAILTNMAGYAMTGLALRWERPGLAPYAVASHGLALVLALLARRRGARRSAAYPTPEPIPTLGPPTPPPTATDPVLAGCEVEVDAPHPIGAVMVRILEGLEHGCDRLLGSHPAPGDPGGPTWPPGRPAGMILEAVDPDWALAVARQCAERARRDLGDPGRWTDALVAELDEPRSDLRSLGRVFARHEAARWVDSRPLDALIASFRPRPDWLTRYFEQAVVPFWWTSAQDHDLDSGVVALDEAAWRLVATDDREGPHRFLLVAWPMAATAVLVRIVQGIPPGSLQSLAREGAMVE